MFKTFVSLLAGHASFNFTKRLGQTQQPMLVGNQYDKFSAASCGMFCATENKVSL
jgi:hypothetical protein